MQNTPMAERFKLHFHAEMFNVFNRINLATDSSAGSSGLRQSRH